MSYNPTTRAIASPFALLTRSTDGSGNAQWDQQSQDWVSASNLWEGNALIWGAPTCKYSAGAVIASVGLSASADRATYGSQWGSSGEARACSDDLILGYGSSATWAIKNNLGTFTLDSTRARCCVMRMEG